MSEPFLGEIRMFGGNFAPRGWAFCNGQLLPISSNTALFSLLGTTYGGDGRTTFALPDLRGRVPMHWGQGPGLSSRSLGESSGSESVTLTSSQMPAHTHSAVATVNASARSDGSSPSGAVPADGGGNNIYSSAPDGSTTMNGGMVSTQIGAAGGSQPHANLQPFLCVSFIIALQGIFPSRN
jgi:microcystin-dependent protein